MRKSQHNQDVCAQLAKFAKANATEYVAECKEQIEAIEVGDLEERFKVRFDSLRDTKRGVSKKNKSDGTITKVQRTNRQPMVCPPCFPLFLTSLLPYIQKAALRRGAFDDLPDNDPWKNKKFEPALEPQIQSDDEDILDEQGNVDKHAWCRRPPTYRNTTVSVALSAKRQ